jgi:hypothetical protein
VAKRFFLLVAGLVWTFASFILVFAKVSFKHFSRIQPD